MERCEERIRRRWCETKPFMQQQQQQHRRIVAAARRYRAIFDREWRKVRYKEQFSVVRLKVIIIKQVAAQSWNVIINQFY